jgi:hypothetical protein
MRFLRRPKIHCRTILDTRVGEIERYEFWDAASENTDEDEVTALQAEGLTANGIDRVRFNIAL